MKPATEKAWQLRRKLEALAERGIDGERDSAKAKLAKLLAAYDFTAPDEGEILFSGDFRPERGNAVPLCSFAGEQEIGQFAKWSIENGTGITCLWRGDSLCAEAGPESLTRLRNIAERVRSSFRDLWTRFAAVPGVAVADKSNFFRGCYDGLLSDERQAGESLPAHSMPKCGRKRRGGASGAKKRALGHASGVAIHPYAVAVELGRKIRLCVGTDEIARHLDGALARLSA